ncbi:GtrA family protein [Trinickia violacea]|uniref:GtrA family protein n=1 Tax=Trinickia violacea TaxID=2571746 RepID=A0A4P8J1D7_9BURK|nr:GtrA family protein [Trinickia violacea]QCP53494.1 GtrA family protein [Trinickia violacea]
MRTTLTRILTAYPQIGRKGFRYLLIGGLNTAFGYFVSVGLYYALTRHLHIVAIGAIANVVSITEAFIAYKLFVFRSHGRWLQEYLRCYVVYGGNALIGIAGLWLLVNVIGIPFWIAQAMLMTVGIVISYVGHDRFTFNKAQRE